MTNKEYFQQALWLDRKINSYIREAERLREMTVSIRSPSLDDKVQTSRPNEAPFVRGVERLMALEERINREIDALVDLKDELRTVIDALPSWEEQTVLRCRYLCGMAREDIGAEMNVSPRTVLRWHGSALAHAVQPQKNN